MHSNIINALINSPGKEDDDASSGESFWAEEELKCEDFQIEVEGVGKILLPLDQTIIQQLQGVSSEAKFGLRTETLLDKKIRDTQEISLDKLHITYNETSFSNLLEKTRDDLGLSENVELTAHLHNMLIYGPGHFFKNHQDSEKLEGMVATLVIALPSPHIGGDLVVHHNKKNHRFVTENIDSKKLQCFAFYADCIHEVETVKQGSRVTLTYNLVLKNKGTHLQNTENKQLEHALKSYFYDEEEVKENSDGHLRDLVYFLDHSYTEHSLQWNMLKGVDRQNALDFCSAAKKLGLIPHLALVDHRESWAVEGHEYDYKHEDFIDQSTVLSHWLDEKGQKLPYGTYTISEDEACWTKDTEDFEPAETEYEGYTGNAGNTVDYWYRRAAVVLWPESDQLSMSFQLNYNESLENLLKLTTQSGNEKKALEILKKVKRYLQKNATEKMFKTFVKLALYVQDEEVSKSVLSEFSLSVFDQDGIKEFVKLQKLYGASWCVDLISYWIIEKKYRPYSDSLEEKDFNQLVMRLQEACAEPAVISYLLNYQINHTIESHKQFLRGTPLELIQSLNDRMETLTYLLKACDLHQDVSLTEKLVQHVISSSLLYPEHALSTLILEAQLTQVMKEGPYVYGYDLLREYVITGLLKEMDKGLREPEDVSIYATLQCQCPLCKTANAFLKSKTEKNKIWPIVQHEREHVIERFKRLGLPVEVSVEKKGSPYKLILVKSDKLYQMDKERFETLKKNYEKLLEIRSSQFSR